MATQTAGIDLTRPDGERFGMSQWPKRSTSNTSELDKLNVPARRTIGSDVEPRASGYAVGRDGGIGKNKEPSREL